jgi:N-acetylneuraminate synthase
MSYKSEEILPIEKEQRAKLKWGCYNADEVKK